MFYRLIVHKFRSISMLIDVDQITFNHIINLYQSFTMRLEWKALRWKAKNEIVLSVVVVAIFILLFCLRLNVPESIVLKYANGWRIIEFGVFQHVCDSWW